MRFNRRVSQSPFECQQTQYLLLLTFPHSNADILLGVKLHFRFSFPNLELLSFVFFPVFFFNNFIDHEGANLKLNFFYRENSWRRMIKILKDDLRKDWLSHYPINKTVWVVFPIKFNTGNWWKIVNSKGIKKNTKWFCNHILAFSKLS